jgi:hypothetical protein
MYIKQNKKFSKELICLFPYTIINKFKSSQRYDIVIKLQYSTQGGLAFVPT